MTALRVPGAGSAAPYSTWREKESLGTGFRWWGRAGGDVQGAEPWLGLERRGEATGCPPGTASSWHPSSSPRHPESHPACAGSCLILLPAVSQPLFPPASVSWPLRLLQGMGGAGGEQQNP